MSHALVKSLIWRCRTHPPPAVLMIEEAEVLPLAKFAAERTWGDVITIGELADQIRAGKLTFYGIPVRTK